MFKTVVFAEYEYKGKGAFRRFRVPWSKSFCYREARSFLDKNFIDGEQWLRLSGEKSNERPRTLNIERQRSCDERSMSELSMATKAAYMLTGRRGMTVLRSIQSFYNRDNDVEVYFSYLEEALLCLFELPFDLQPIRLGQPFHNLNNSSQTLLNYQLPEDR
ncbi:hypothetical protein Fmac_020505 [Flemingia macrophylla]|uniref:Uncharacterized protein n=1 Tax=Flemingia macrophylla TaxID=520843 RepID=A0ABD1LUU6_9FABA